MATDRGDQIELPSAYLEAGHVQHAYALTGHATQGLTAEQAFVLGAERGQLREWGYVALSRARDETRLYVTEPIAAAESHFHEIDDRDAFTRLAQALEESGAERLASEQQPQSPPSRSCRPALARRTREERELAAAREHLRLLASVEAQTERARALAQKRFVEATERLAGLGWRGRRREVERLRGEAARERSALNLAEAKLAKVEKERRRALERLTRAQERALQPARERGRTAEQPAPARVPERQLNLDLGL